MDVAISASLVQFSFLAWAKPFVFYFFSIYRFRPDIGTRGCPQPLFSVCPACSSKLPKDQVSTVSLRVSFAELSAVTFASEAPEATVSSESGQASPQTQKILMVTPVAVVSSTPFSLVVASLISISLSSPQFVIPSCLQPSAMLESKSYSSPLQVS